MGKFKKKKGSTFIIVVFVTAIIFTLATTMIAVVTNDYKMRINESNKVQNLYASDSGLDAVYSIISKDSNMAVMYALNKVKFDSENIGASNINTYTDDHINELYQQAFYNFLSRGLSNTTNEIVAADTVNDNQIPADSLINTSTARLLVYSILNLKYFDKPQITSPTNADLAVMSNYGFNADTKNQNSINLADPNRTIKITSIDLNPTEKKIVIGLSSTFKTDTTSGTGYANTKTIETKYTITAPDYNKNIERGTIANSVDIYAVQRALVADGDLIVKDGVDATVTTKNGSDNAVWIGGIHYDNYNADDYKKDKYNVPLGYAYSKYNYGITVDNYSSLNVTGNVATNETFNLANNANASVSNNLYAKNAYLGQSNGGVSTQDSLTVNNSLITNNDLTINSTDSSVMLSKYFGISDKQENVTNPISAAEQSSSIIVNKADSKNSIYAKEAYVAGVAYIDTQQSDDTYQTGESVSVKGNAVAYTTKIPGSTVTANVRQFDKFLDFGDNSVAAKENQFIQYFGATNDLKDGGIKIDTLHAVGASTINNKNTPTPSNWGDSDKEIDNQRTNYTTDLYKMGDSLIGTATNDDIKGNNPTNMLTVGHQNQRINFDSITKNYIEDRSIYKNYGQLVLATKVNRPKGTPDGMTISGTKITYGGKTYDLGNSKGEIEAVIVTDEDITITGDTNFKGSIITKGNITIQGDNTSGVNAKKVNIEFDAAKVQQIMAQYEDPSIVSGNDKEIYDILNATSPLFVGDPIYSFATATVNTSDYVNLSADSELYDSSKYLKKGLWKLLKETGEVIEQK